MNSPTSAADAIERVKAMTAPSQQTWDLSPKDVEALKVLLVAAEAGFAVSAQLEQVRTMLQMALAI